MTMSAVHIYGEVGGDERAKSAAVQAGQQQGRGFGPIGMPALAAATAFLRRKPQDKIVHPLPAILWDEHKTS